MSYLLLTIPEAAEEIRMSEGYIKKAIREGRLLARKFGRHTRIERQALERWIALQPVRNVVNVEGQDGAGTKNPQSQVIEKTVSARS